MSKIALDLKNFKHVKSDDKTTTLRHKDGHDLTISHKSLSPVAKQQLAALAKMGEHAETSVQRRERRNENDNTPRFEEGGRVPASVGNTEDQDQPKDMREKPPKNEFQVLMEDPKGRWEHIKREASGLFGGAKQKAEGGCIDSGHMYADGGKVKDAEDRVKNVNKKQNEVGKKHFKPVEGEAKDKNDKFWDDAELLLKGRPRKKLADGGDVGDQAADAIEGDKAGFLDNLKSFFHKYSDPAELGAGIVRGAKEIIPAAVEGFKESPYGKAAEFGANMLKGAADESGVTARLNAPEPEAMPQAQPAAMQAPMPQPMMQQPAAPQLVVETPPAPPQQPVGGVLAPDISLQGAENSFVQGAKQEQKAAIEAGKAAGQIAEERGNAEAQAAAQMQELQAHMQSRHQESMDEMAAQRRAIQAGQIDPERYWKGDPKTGEGSHSKVAAGIGMILAGFNPTNQPNAAINYINTQIDRNIQAQKGNLESQHNLLKASMDQYNNETVATQTAKILMTDAAAHQILAAGAKSQNKLAQQNAMMAAGKLQQENSVRAQALAQYKTMLGLIAPQGQHQQGNQAANPMQQEEAFKRRTSALRFMGQEGMAKDMEAKHVPGIGDASREVPNDAREKILGHQKLEGGLADLQNFVKNNTTLIPGTPAYTAGQVKALKLQSEIRENLLGTVYKEGEQPLLDKFLQTNPAGILKFITGPQLAELQAGNQRDFNKLKASYGLPVSQASPQQDSQQPVKGKDGRMYIRRGNFMVPVK